MAQSLAALYDPPLVLVEVSGGWSWRAESGGIATFDHPPANSLHSHNCFEISYVISGSGQFLHGDTLHSLKTGDVFLAEPEIRHEISSWKTRDLLIIYYFFHVEPIPSGGDTGGGESALWDLFMKKHRLCAEAPRETRDFLMGLRTRHSCMGETVRRGHLRTMLMELVATCLPEEEQHSLQKPIFDGFNRALIHIRQNFQHHPSVVEVARVAGTTPRTLNRWFQRHLGLPVQQVIIQFRMEWAARRLTMGMRVREVAGELDFPTPEQFSAAFKSWWKIEPRRFRDYYQPGVTMHRTLWNEHARASNGSRPRA
ncbi:MAG: AraC family transcriptional regulator [Candidatus Methylacidiphilales bacterium]|nr:AraC family transcriptional regulator [Candidatus Methylacidiphilales bacterium]